MISEMTGMLIFRARMDIGQLQKVINVSCAFHWKLFSHI